MALKIDKKIVGYNVVKEKPTDNEEISQAKPVTQAAEQLQTTFDDEANMPAM